MIGLYFRAARELGWRTVAERLGRLALDLNQEAVKTLGWQTVAERLRRLALDLNQAFGCEVCGATWPAMFPFMVDDALWCEVADEDAHLCLDQMKRQVGRGLYPGDFTDVPINKAVLAGVAIARGSSSTREGSS